ncbi:helix-turn-helix transcriptional regulator [Arthrobacter sp. SDTb3-6]|uniref:helix-turn-helix transcriptional regulator n=1 Tax=Arthrobacter sp. SDTb3-6 TaxID=2713571 RepID=UPI00159DAB90|nr:helix-turn-helix transcriptional regulator [Arthrobacter sp. SDTb3-6]NVM97318.1 helix-turn-helix domain-containing protein [Arthrobacter sp. SDTb3-6]
MNEERRRELGQFLRGRRAGLLRADLGLPPIGRSRTMGLRREEVAAFAAVSVTWYTWLEQGRDINASRQVLESVGRVLRLSVAELDYVLALGGHAPVHASGSRAIDDIPPHLQALLDALDFPAFAVAPDWGIAGWNAAYALLYSRIVQVDPSERNLLWLVFTDPQLRQMLPDWEVTSRHFVTEFRAEAGSRIGSPEHTALVDRLSAASPEFAGIWGGRGVQGFASRQRVFLHPAVGSLVFEQHRLVPSDAPELHFVLYVPTPGTPTKERLAGLAGR